MINFSVRNVFPGTPAQTNVGIHATFNMNIEGPDGVIAAINDMKLMRSKEGKYYVESPFRTYDGKDKETGNPKKVKINYIKFFPEKKDWDKQDAIVKLVLDAIPNKGATPAPTAPRQQNNQNNNKNNYSRPATPAKSTNNEPW